MPVARAELSSDEARQLIAALDAELQARYPEPGANHFDLSEDEVAPGRGAFVVARDAEGRAVACGAVRKLDAASAEVKRMFVVREARGRGLGREVLAALEAEAAALGVSRLVLETGHRQPEAVRLYEEAGFVHIPPFGEYVDSPLSVCLEKRLSPRRPG